MRPSPIAPFFVAVLGLLLAACGADGPGELVIAVTSDMPVPKDIGEVGIEVRRAGRPDHQKVYRLGPAGELLPLTLSVREQKKPGEPITVRVTAWQGPTLRILREVVTTIPRGRKALLSIELQWLCDGQVKPGATPSAPTEVSSLCAAGQTCIQGQCRSSTIAAGTLPDYKPELVYGGGKGVADARCFDLLGCLGAAVVVPVDGQGGTCAIERPGPGVGLNVAMVLPRGGSGTCSADACFVAIDGMRDREGWSEKGNKINLPPGVCQGLADGRVVGVAVSTSCPTKTISLPLCDLPSGPPTMTTMPTTPTPMLRDGGVVPGPSADGGVTDSRPGMVDAPVATDGRTDAAAPVDARGDTPGPSPDLRAPPPDARVDMTVACEARACTSGDGCCPSRCNANQDKDCPAVCGNKVVEKGELCDGDCPTACAAEGCNLRRLEGAGTCQARCVAASQISMCTGGDKCCPMGCTYLTDGDCACTPATETCNGKDDDCDREVDEGVKTTFYRDRDGDMRGDKTTSSQACSAPAGFVTSSDDCDDNDVASYPGAVETCDGEDNDCDGTVDDGVKRTFYRDADGDGRGAAATTTQACSAPAGYTTTSDDCNDGNAAVKPGAAETCNGVDDDCDGTIDDGVLVTFYRDRDRDGYGTTPTAEACVAPAGFAAAAGDCDEANGAVNPGATEACNFVDDDCDGTIDEACPASSMVPLPGGYPTLTAQHAACTAEQPFGSPCYAASHRYCSGTGGPFTVAGFGPIETVSGTLAVGCLNGNVTTGHQGVFGWVTPHHGGCTSATAWSPQCFTAIHRWCGASGFVSGVGPLEHMYEELHFACLARATVYTRPATSLAPFHAGCTGMPVAFSQACLSAYHRFCRSRGHETGFGPVEMNGVTDEVVFTCVPRD